MRAPEHDLFCEPAQMGHHDAASGNEFDKIIAVAYCIHAVFNYAVEPELACNHGPVDREGGAGQRRRAERKFIQPFVAVLEPLKVSLEH